MKNKLVIFLIVSMNLGHAQIGDVIWEDNFDNLDNSLMIKKMPGFYVAGEMLDWEAPTGGYLLQGCFSTAYRASQSILSFLNNEAT